MQSDSNHSEPSECCAQQHRVHLILGPATAALFLHHKEARSQNLVSESAENCNGHSYNCAASPLQLECKLAWIPQKSDFPILDEPTLYGLLEDLMKNSTRKKLSDVQCLPHFL
uniref:Uncharacterized protein n=1 Tax=Zonotrichia albicollis TaxID=44394 RepID=A0A8D2QH39_ZONAL